MRVAYERVSTAGQSTLRQDVMMQEQKIEKIFIEKYPVRIGAGLSYKKCWILCVKVTW